MTTYEIRDENCRETIEAESMEAAKEVARKQLEDLTSDESKTLFLSCWVVETDEIDEEVGDSEQVEVTLHPTEPPCTCDEGHQWESPLAIVGGLKENPGVFCHGGGVIMHECCVNCGCRKTTDTWAQDSNGRQGLESVEYEPRCYSDVMHKLDEVAE